MNTQDPTASVEDFTSRKYDFVICGGGTAGLVLASRLTENPDITVGVIEAGQYLVGDQLVDTPAFFPQMFNNERYDWIIKSIPQKGNRGNVHHIPRGKLLGGSSGINYMMYVRGSKQDYDDWAELADDPSWGSTEMNKYFMKHETMDPISDEVKDRSSFAFVEDYHGSKGPIHTSFNEERSELEDTLCKSFKEVAGFPADHLPIDPWSGDHIGFYSTLGTVSRVGPNRGKRSYAASGYFEPNRTRPNLKVICNALVHKILLGEGDTIVTGVEFSYGTSTYEVSANREVLVCGGALKTPQILELSGIGDPEVLRNAGVKCKVENRDVGAHFQDHMISPLVYQLRPGGLTSLDSLTDPEQLTQAMSLLQESKTGPLTSIGSLQGFIPFKKISTPDELAEAVKNITETEVKTDYERRQLKQIVTHLQSDISANLQFVAIPVTMDFDNGISDQKALFAPIKQGTPNGFTLVCILQYPVARGSVHITSADPTAQPAVNPAYGESPADKLVLAAGLRLLERATKTATMEPHILTRVTPAANVDLQQIDQGKSAVEDVVAGAYHACGSCAIGAALDNKLKVHGVKNLRVCDASVFPNHVSGNIQGTVYATAEKGADIIKADHGI